MKKPRKKKQKPSPEPQPAKPAAEPKPAATAAAAGPRRPGRRDSITAAAPDAPERVEFAETSEPSAAGVSMPVLIIALLGVLVFVADMYLMDHSGQFSDMVYYPNKEVPPPPGGDLVVLGKATYSSSCAACHQPNGAGNEALNFPPLVGSEWVQTEGPARLIRIVLNGLAGPIEVKGKQYGGAVMVPWRDTLTDEQIAAVLTYVRQAWGNQASPVTPEQVKLVREATSDRQVNWTAAELLAIPDAL